MPAPKLLIGSPVRQKPAVLKRFLDSLHRLDTTGIEVDFLFVDDNTDEMSSRLLREFVPASGHAEIIHPSAADQDDYLCDDYSHHWKEHLIWKVAAIKDGILAAALQRRCSHVFLADSDLVFHPRTLLQLIGDRKDIVSTLYWTRWQPNTIEMPQVWLHGEYDMHPLSRRATGSELQLEAQRQRFMYQLRTPGVYEVGGLGACTLISRKALQAGVRFAEIKNLAYWGEDRHFCIRAAALGFGLHVDTAYPAFHMYRETDLADADEYVVNGWRNKQAAVVEAERRDNGIHYRTAYEMIAYGYNQAAIDELEQFLADGGGTKEDRIRVLLEIDACFGRSGYPELGRDRLLRAMAVYNTAEIYCRLGSKCMDNANWDEAIAWFKLAVRTARPDDWEQSPDIASWTWKPYIQLCVCHVRKNDLHRAHEYNELGLRFEPEHPTMLSNREFLMRELHLAPDPASAR